MSAAARIRCVAGMQARVLLRERRAHVLFVFATLLLLVTLWCGAALRSGEDRIDRAGRVAARQAFTDWLAAYGNDPWRPVYTASENPILLARAAPPLAILSRGVLDRVGRWTIATGFSTRELDGVPAELSPFSALLGGLNLAGLFATLGALVAVLIAHDAITRERELGTWALHLAARVAPVELHAGKVLGAFFAAGVLICLPLAAALAAMCALIGTGAAVRAASAFWLLALAYVALWVTLAVAVSARSDRSSTALARLVVLWLLATLVWPRAAAGIAVALAPVSHAAEVEGRTAAALEEANAGYAESLKAYQKERGARPDAVSVAKLKLAYYEDLRKRLVPVLEKARNEARAQERVFASLACLSPAFALELAASSLAGTGSAGHVEFLDEAASFGWKLRRDAEERIIRGQNRPPTWSDIQALAPPGSGLDTLEEAR